jgi:predicted nucleic acid-binding protein
MTGRVFVDTNVLLYALDAGAPAKQRAARTWRDVLWRNRSGRVSFQVLQEFYVQACRLNPKAREAARADIRDLLAWDPVICDETVLLAAFSIQDDFGFSFWDALIVASAQAAECRYLLTEDLQHGQDIRGLLVVNPFKSRPEELATENP